MADNWVVIIAHLAYQTKTGLCALNKIMDELQYQGDNFRLILAVSPH